ncbi:MAG: hypothetical protein KGI54_17090 [Pseudomonadota bacterium]|nr:hypothetical protein [Pseudomonadota bacterium]
MQQLKWFYGTSKNKDGFFWDIEDTNGINQKKQEYLDVKRNDPLTCANIYQAAPISDFTQIFVQDYFVYYAPPSGLEMGVSNPEVQKFIEKGAHVIQAWDTAFSNTATSDYNVCITGLLVPCSSYHRDENPNIYGPCDHHFDIYILDAWRQRASYAEVVQQIRIQNIKWQPNIIVVEKQAYGAPALEALANSGLPLIPVQPIQGKRSRAVEGVGAGSVQGWFRNHRVNFPAQAAWLEALETELLAFTGEKGGKDDQADALIHLCQFAIREGTTAGIFPSEWDTIEKVDKMMLGGQDYLLNAMQSHDATLESFIKAGLIDGADGMCCATCQFYWKENSLCGKHRYKTSSIASCDDWADEEWNTAFGR